MIITVYSNQNIYDVCLQYYGTLERLDVLIQDNGLNYDAELTQGQLLTINDSLTANKDVKEFFNLNNKTIANGYNDKNKIPLLSFDNDDITFDDAILTWDLTKI